MIKCPNCNQENSDGSKFCSTCGKKLEVFLTCPSCGGQVAYGSAFCSQCGKNLNGQDDGMLSGSVVAGDVAITTANSNNNTTNTVFSGPVFNGAINGTMFNGPINGPIINNTYQDSLIKCRCCDKKMVKGSKDVHICASCGNSFCNEHFDIRTMICNDCLKKAVESLCSHSYTQARLIFESAIANGATAPAVYYYAAISLLEGKKPFVHQRATIDKIVKYVEVAINADPQAAYYYFLAYVKYDFYERKYFNVRPDYKTCYKLAINYGITEKQKSDMYSLLGVDRPSCL